MATGWDWPTLRVDAGSLSALRDGLVGRRLQCVRYFPLGDEPYLREGAQEPAFHDAFHGVELEFGDDAVLGVFWLMHGLCHGLRVLMDARRPEEWRITPMDVSDANEWRAIIDQTIDGLQVLWHESEADVPLAVFAVKLEFGKTDVVLALGKSPGLSDAPRPSGIQYIPDSVVVIFDDEVFRSYIAEGDPSWVHTDWEPV